MIILIGITLVAIYNTSEEKTIKVVNTDFSIKCMISGGKVLNSKLLLEAESLLVRFNSTHTSGINRCENR